MDSPGQECGRHYSEDTVDHQRNAGIARDSVLRRLSYTNFDSEAWKKDLGQRFPGPSSARSTRSSPVRPCSIKNKEELRIIPITSTLTKDVPVVKVDLRTVTSMFSEEYNLRMISIKDHPYRHLNTSSSVESNDSPADNQSSKNRLTIERSGDRVQSIRSNSTMISRVSIEKGNDSSVGVEEMNEGLEKRNENMVSSEKRNENMVHLEKRSENMISSEKSNMINLEKRNHSARSQRMRKGERDSSNEDDHGIELPYYPHSPHITKKPMIFERQQSRTGSASLLKIPALNMPVKQQHLTEARNVQEVVAGHRIENSSPNLIHNGQNGITVTERVTVNVDIVKRRTDFILAYEHGLSESLDRQRQYFETNLEHEGLVLDSDPADCEEYGNKLCFVRVHAPWDTLCRTAELLQMKMPLRNAELPTQCVQLSPVNDSGLIGTIREFFFSNWFGFNDTEKILIGAPANHVTAQFTINRLEKFLLTNPDTFFTATQRIRIVYEIMQKARCDPDDGKKRGVQWLLKRGVYTAAYPPHDGATVTRDLATNDPSKWTQRQILKHTWANFNRLFKPQPLHLIRAYFGENIGFYFAWLGFYTKMLVFPSIVGVVCFLSGVFSLSSNPVIMEICSEDHHYDHVANVTMCPVCRLPNCRPWMLRDSCESAHWNYRFDNESHVIMTVFTLLWSTVFMEMWKRKEAELAAEWDAYDAEQAEEPIRPEYEARTKTVRISPVTNEEEPYVQPWKRIMRLTASAAGVFLLILCVILALMALIIVRIALYGILSGWGGLWAGYKFEIASLIVHVFTFMIVMTLGTIYEPTAHRLTELECPRTQADYLSSYVWKVFVFELLNNFIPILYASLIRGRVSLPHKQNWVTEMCDPGGCLNEVVQAVAVLLLARLLISNTAELGVPFLKRLMKSKGLNRTAVHPDDDSRNIPRWQRDYALNEPNLDGVYAEYLEMMVQFGYVTLFIAAFPLAPLICLINNLIEIRLDATNFVQSFRRPLPARVSGIRTWKTCLNIIIKLSVLCNGAFLAFTSELVPTLIYRYKQSDDGSTRGYLWWSMSRFNTTDWQEYLEFAPNSTECYYRDFRHANYDRKLIWWQVMVARLTFFVVFVTVFYFIQWLCDFLVPDVPKHVKLKIDRANFVARQALYGKEDEGKSKRVPHVDQSSRRVTSNHRHVTVNGHAGVEMNGSAANGIGVNGHLTVNSDQNRSNRKHWTGDSDHLHPNQLPVSPV